jgi:hypothetical protein
MNHYRVRLTRLVEQETSIDVIASSVEAAAVSAIGQVHDGLHWNDSRYEPSSHAVDDIVRLPDPPELLLEPAARRGLYLTDKQQIASMKAAQQVGQFEAGALARDQRKPRR